MIPLVSPCAIPHHAPDSRVGFHQWDDGIKAMRYRFGTVRAHFGRRIQIDLGYRVVETECGHVFPVGEMGGE